MRRHPTDTVSLIGGLAFTTTAILWLTGGFVVFTPQTIGMVFAAVFIVAAVPGLVRALRRPNQDATSGDSSRGSPD